MGEYLASNEGVGGYADGVLAIIATLPLIGVAEVDEKLLATPFGELLQAKMEAFATCLGAFYVVVYLRATQARVLQLIPMINTTLAGMVLAELLATAMLPVFLVGMRDVHGRGSGFAVCIGITLAVIAIIRLVMCAYALRKKLVSPPHHESHPEVKRISEEEASITFNLVWLRALSMLFCGTALAVSAPWLGPWSFLVFVGSQLLAAAFFGVSKWPAAVPAGRRILMNLLWDKDRYLIFRDALFGIVATLLVLEVKFEDPSGNADAPVTALIWDNLPTISGYILTFYTVGIHWLVNHHLFLHIDYLRNRGGIILGLYYSVLSTMQLIPFIARLRFGYAQLALAGSSTNGHHVDLQNARYATATFFAANTVTGLLHCLAWYFTVRWRRVHAPRLTPYRGTKLMFMAAAVPAWCGVLMGLSFVTSYINYGFVLMPVVWYLADQAHKRIYGAADPMANSITVATGLGEPLLLNDHGYAGHTSTDHAGSVEL